MKKKHSKKDQCVCGGTETQYDEFDHIDFRYFYVEGAGQLCPECYNETVDDLNVDECGICNGDNYEIDCVDIDTCSLMDCSGICFGDSALDECGICNGDGYTCNAPQANDFSFELNEDDVSVEFSLPITDQNGDLISLELIFETVHGVLSFDETTFNYPYDSTPGFYSPDSEFSGLDEFSYYVQLSFERIAFKVS